jgi:hypothetical protein
MSAVNYFSFSSLLPLWDAWKIAKFEHYKRQVQLVQWQHVPYFVKQANPEVQLQH